MLAYPGTAAGSANGTPLYELAGYQDEDFMHLPIDRPPTWPTRGVGRSGDGRGGQGWDKGVRLARPPGGW